MNVEIENATPTGRIVYGMPREEYDDLERIHWSKLKLLEKSPALYQHALIHGDKDSDAKKVGRAGHLVLLEPEEFRRRTVVWDGGRRFGKEWNAFKKKHADRDILTPAEAEFCTTLGSAVRHNRHAAKYLSGGRAEVAMLWTHRISASAGMPAFEFLLKGRVDFDSADVLVDLKTTRDASPDGFAKEAWRYRYDAQAAFYVDGYFAATGRRKRYVIVAVEKDAPHIVQAYVVPDHILEVGREHYQNLLGTLGYCRHENKWDGYFDGELELTLPKWAHDFSEDNELGDLGLTFTNQ